MDSFMTEVLLVEDEVIIAMSERKELEKHGYAVNHVMNGESAIRQALDKDVDYDLILMDIDLGPGIDGTKAAEEILKYRDIPIVFLTSHTEPEIVNQTEKITSYGYVVKNTGIVVLDASIKMALKLFKEKTDRNQAEEMLKSERDQMLSVFNSIDEPIYVSDPETYEMLYVNMYIKKLFPEIRPGSKCYKVLQGLDSPCPFCTNEAIRECKPEPIRWEHHNLHLNRYYSIVDRIIRWTDGRDVRFELALDITERKKVERDILRQLSEKETLLKEVHHRIKNNIESIESLLRLNADSSSNSEVKNALQESISRVQSTRILYDKLLLSEYYHDVSIDSYLGALIESFVANFPEYQNVTIKKNITDFTLGSDKAILIGIIINELLTNIYKHAFTVESTGCVAIDLTRFGNRVTLTIKDNGIGIDNVADIDKSPGFGLSIVRMLAEQLRGRFSIECDNGTRSVLEFEI